MNILWVVPFLMFVDATVTQTSLFTLEDEVKAEDFSYYKVFHPGNLLLILHSLEGDADIYVSDKNPTPTYDPKTYDLQSSTCGVDSVYAPREMKRPVIVGIYGHFVHNKSRYVLEVYRMPEREDFFSEEQLDISSENQGESYEMHSNRDDSRASTSPISEDNSDTSKRKSAPRTKRKSKSIPSGLWPLLELFEVLFL